MFSSYKNTMVLNYISVELEHKSKVLIDTNFVNSYFMLELT